MLQAIRDKAQGWIAWAIVILISIPFALFGIQEYLGSGADPVVADVNGIEITESELDKGMRDFRESMRLSLGDAYRQELFEGEAFRQQVLDRVINESVLRQTAHDWNMRGSDVQVRGYIQSIPSFQNQGQFDTAMYEAAVRNRGLSNAGFEDLVRQELVMRQLQSGIGNSGFATDSQVSQEVRLGAQKRSIEYARIPMSVFNDPQAISEEDAKSYYEANSVSYRVPERVKLAYVSLDTNSLKPLVEVDEDKLQTYFEEHRDEFFVEEERKVRHILVASAAGKEEEQKAKAQSLLEQLLAGADFAELAQENSDDPGSAANGGDLGWVNRGAMVKPFEDSAFSLEPQALSDLVKTDFGYHILQVTDVRGGSDATFEQMRSEIESAYRRFHAEELFYDYHERLANAAYENADSLEPAAETLGLTIKQTDWVERAGALPPGIDNPKVINAAFSEDVLVKGNNSDVLDLGPTEAVVIRVVEHEAETTKPFASVRDQVMAEAAASLASDKAAAKGSEVIEQLRNGQVLADIAQVNGWPHQDAEIARNQQDLPAELVQAAFLVTPPEEGQKAHTGIVSAEGDYFVVAINQVEDGQAGENAAEEMIRRQRLVSLMGGAEFDGALQALRERSGVEIFSE